MVIMENNRWFRDQLLTSADGLIWAIEQVPESRRNTQPPDGLGEWSAVRHSFHIRFYEQTTALPIMRQWFGAAGLSTDPLEGELDAWVKEQGDVETLLTRFKKVRLEQIALLHKFTETDWNVTRDTIWGTVTLLWVVSKTYQHTAEHISDILKIALFWDVFASRQKTGA
jgi:hypothetical protein